MQYVVVKNMRKSLNELWNPGEVVSDIPYSVVSNLLSLGWIKPLESSVEDEKTSSEKKQVKRRGRPSKKGV